MEWKYRYVIPKGEKKFKPKRKNEKFTVYIIGSYEVYYTNTKHEELEEFEEVVENA